MVDHTILYPLKAAEIMHSTRKKRIS